MGGRWPTVETTGMYCQINFLYQISGPHDGEYREPGFLQCEALYCGTYQIAQLSPSRRPKPSLPSFVLKCILAFLQRLFHISVTPHTSFSVTNFRCCLYLSFSLSYFKGLLWRLSLVNSHVLLDSIECREFEYLGTVTSLIKRPIHIQLVKCKSIRFTNQTVHVDPKTRKVKSEGRACNGYLSDLQFCINSF
jgi:hypothetical protein